MDIIKKVEYTSEEKETIGATAHWIGEAGGVKSEWDTETTEWEPYSRGAWRSTGGTFTGIGSMTLTPIDSGTKTTFVMDYDLPYSILGRIIDKLRRLQSRRERNRKRSEKAERNCGKEVRK